jgi:hypothetical protein
MKAKSIGILCCIVLIMGVFVSCDGFGGSEPDFDIEYFDRLKLQGPITVTLVQGTKNEVLTTTISEVNFHSQGNNTLFIQGSGSATISVLNLDYIHSQSATVKSTDPIILDELEFNNYSGHIELNQFSVGQFSLYSTGVEFVELNGTSNNSNINLGPGSHLRGYDFICDTLQLSTGDGNAEVHVLDYLKVSVTTSGNTIYKGNPDTVIVNGLGSGTVTPF